MKYLKKYEMNYSKESYDSIEQVKEEFEYELSKYFTKIPYDKLMYSGSIFLLSPDYGVKIRKIENHLIGYVVELSSIRFDKNINDFQNGIFKVRWCSNKTISIENVVKEFADKVMKINIQRLKNKETVELKRMTKKYNIV